MSLPDAVVRADRRPLDRLLRARGVRLRRRALHRVVGRTDDERRVAINTHRPVLGRQRGLAGRRRRRHLRRLPGLVRHLVLRRLPRWSLLLLVALILRGVSFEFRGKVDTQRWRRTWSVDADRRQRCSRRCVLGSRSATCWPGCPSTPTRSSPAPSGTCSPPYGVWTGAHAGGAVPAARRDVPRAADHRRPRGAGPHASGSGWRGPPWSRSSSFALWTIDLRDVGAASATRSCRCCRSRCSWRC